jgi:hypothetical protein
MHRGVQKGAITWDDSVPQAQLIKLILAPQLIDV